MRIFTNIYKYNLWGFGSGTGSLKFNNIKYINFLNNFLKSHSDINNILDYGCGDWQLNKHINFETKKYLGIDIVNSVIQKNKKLYSNKNIKFKCYNFLEEPFEAADLLIIKDVLQHLSDENLQKFCDKLSINKHKYKYIIITNDVSKLNLNYIDIPNGMYKPIDIIKAPYNFKAETVLQYYEKIYLFLFISILVTMSILVYKKGYKLYIFSFGLLILYGIFILPKKTVYLLK